MKVLVVGGGGREHALAWKLSKSNMVTNVFVAPGNGGTEIEELIQNIDIDANDIDSLSAFAKKEGIFKKRLVAGAMVFSYGLGLVATNCVNSFSYGYDKLRFIKPVFIGDTIYTIRTNMNKRPKYLKMGLVRTSYEVYKDEGELVLYCEHLHSVTYKNPEDFKDKAEVKK